MYVAQNIAKYIICKCSPLTNLRLQKLMYFVQASFITLKKDFYFCEDMEAWRYGPVLPEIYKEYRFYGSLNITENIEDDFEDIGQSDIEVIDSTLESLRSYTTSELIEISHRQDPWIDARKSTEGNKITKEQMVRYFGR